MALSDEFLDDLRRRADIESTVSSYVSLKRKGKILTGLCPFHNEKTPSFTVYPETQSYYCFGCGNGGDVITFIRNIEISIIWRLLSFLPTDTVFPCRRTDMIRDSAKKGPRCTVPTVRRQGSFTRSSIRRRAGRALSTFIRVALPMIQYVISGSDTLPILGTILKIILCQRVTVSSFCMRRIF